MSLNDTVSAERVHIGFFGMRNAGKSSLVNAVTGQALSVVSDVKGTTTDPVKKAMELLPLGPVLITDTPGLDDEGELGEKRVQKAKQILAQTDIAVLVIDGRAGPSPEDEALLSLFKERKLPYVLAFNKADLLAERRELTPDALYVSAATGEGIHALKERLGSFAKGLQNPKRLVADLLSGGDMAVLVVPVDEAAPKGRLILPQQQVMRDLLDAHCSFAVCQDTELRETLASLAKPPKLVITDSQAFGRVSRDVPEEILLTSFSILFARYKGDLPLLVRGAAQLSHLREGDRVLISEGCTHHRQCGDIGTVKLPGWIEAYTGVKPVYTFTSGGEFPEDLSSFALVIHCGACMLNGKEMEARLRRAADAGVPVVNYGIAIAQMHGILERSLRPFPELLELLQT
ncbi:MAG: [FeFe] hydrogenase H-cluster maturation GTPase HydF [Oscillospiraceae bacterium]|nr:[FeFe] hydrogenase H-cluster maturation GTPase HydF [Oscillospiraceae bacterium]